LKNKDVLADRVQARLLQYGILMALWLYGFMALWLYGFMALWLYDLAKRLLYDLQLHDTAAINRSSSPLIRIIYKLGLFKTTLDRIKYSFSLQ
jgi:hypothetical protein